MAGQGTVALELLDQVPDVGTVLVPVGGGGLLAGVAAVLADRQPGARVVAVEPALAGDLAEGLAAGHRVSWSRDRTVRTIADGLRSPAVGALAWTHLRSQVYDAVTVSEDAIVEAMRRLGDAGVVSEPSGAVAVAALLEHAWLATKPPVAAVVTGRNVDLTTWRRLTEHGPA